LIVQLHIGMASGFVSERCPALRRNDGPASLGILTIARPALELRRNGADRRPTEISRRRGKKNAHRIEMGKPDHRRSAGFQSGIDREMIPPNVERRISAAAASLPVREALSDGLVSRPPEQIRYTLPTLNWAPFVAPQLAWRKRPRSAPPCRFPGCALWLSPLAARGHLEYRFVGL
jgi:hypothetical protein